MQSKATSVEQYLKELPEDRRPQIEQVRNIVLENLPEGIEETMNWGMISYEIPLSICPDTYNKKPLLYAALASQKNNMAIYLSGIYADEKSRTKFQEGYLASGKKMDMGKSCVRFRSIDNLPLNIIGEAIRAFTMEEFIELYKKGRRNKKGR